MGRDLRDGLRRLARRPGFTLLAAGTLALGMATSTAVFTYVNAYARPFPGAGADDLFQIWLATEEEPWGSVLAVAKSVLGPVGRSLLVGLGTGLAGAFVATRWIGGLLWGVAPADPLALAVGVGVLLTTVALAVQIPLRRALKIDPAGCLRAE